MKAKTKIGTAEDYIKAMRKASRELEIEMHGKPLGKCSIRYKSKRDYNRQKDKESLKKVTSDFFIFIWSNPKFDNRSVRRSRYMLDFSDYPDYRHRHYHTDAHKQIQNEL